MTGTRRTARQAFQLLRECYGGGNMQYAILAHKRLALSYCHSIGGIPAFVQAWASLAQTLRDTQMYPLSYATLSLDVVNMLPPAFQERRNKVVEDMSNPAQFNQATFDKLLMDIANQASGITINLELSCFTRNPRTPPKPRAQCGNPKCPNPVGHTTATCWNEGGGDPGGKERYAEKQKQRTPARANFAEGKAPIDAPADIDQPDNNIDTSTNECTTSTESNEDTFYSYMATSFDSILPLANALFELQDSDPKAYYLALEVFKALLDSGTTHHIVKDRLAFHTYDESKAIPVKTANCGILTTHAMGEAHINVDVGGRTATIVLHECLHAPDAPINLISVGALTENGMYIGFGKHKTTCYFPQTHKTLKGLSFKADVIGRLSFLNCKFTSPPPATANAMLPAYTKPELDTYLWHCRTGHPSQETTRRIISGKARVTGVKWNGKAPHEFCPSCIIGKRQQAPYDHNSHRAADVLELIHIDTCGPMLVKTPQKQDHFFAMLDDVTSFNNAEPIAKRNECTGVFKDTQALWENQTEKKVKKVHCDGALEFTKGDLGQHLTDSGIEMQVTAPYAHQQNGKAERFIRTLEDDIQTYLADSGLPMSFWGDALHTASYIRRRIPTSTLPGGKTPYKAMHNKIPDLSHLRRWGCQCFVTIPPELRKKAGPRQFEAIFVGYQEGRKGWLVRDLAGKYHFSRDVEFNENTPGRLSSKRRSEFDLAIKSNTHIDDPNDDTAPTLLKRIIKPTPKMAAMKDKPNVGNILPRLQTDDAAAAFAAYFFAESITSDLDSPQTSESIISSNPHAMLSYHASRHLKPKVWDLTKPPLTYKEAMSRPDHDLWQVAIEAEYKNLVDQDVIEECSLPKGKKAIGSRWTFVRKSHPIVLEKAWLVAQGFSQRPDDYGETYAPVAKMVSVRLVLALAAKDDLELYTFDVKAAFLNAPLSQEVYIRQIPGFPLPDPKAVLRLKKALYGLKQSSHEWFNVLRDAMMSLGLESCIVDPAVFYGRWTSPPDPSIPMPSNGSALFIIIPVHVDDGLSATNSAPLYDWLIVQLNKRFKINDLGPADVFLGIKIKRDRPNRKLRISQTDYIEELLHSYSMDSVNPTSVPLRDKLHNLKPYDNQLAEIPDEQLTHFFQRLNGQLLYPAVCTRPDLAFTTAALGQYNAKPTRPVAAAAKGVLRYLAGTRDYSLEYGGDNLKQVVSELGLSSSDVAYCDSDWGTNEVDRRSFSGYAIFLYGGLVSWSASKQKSTSLSSTESEYMALTHLMKELLWIKLFLTSLSLPFTLPFPVRP
ncbi:uncharacterized protein ARMOST_20281 [Armillaria ostoyae]|uniref:Integrase catalytic domain-containing protein n=1 Tax=Armillaria ostoyae TaxID=47428 RepID=A0A284S6V6_ARMOS|nr:uncharacterized protein ARMOST_20281 [Armillaria ostoyae]